MYSPERPSAREKRKNMKRILFFCVTLLILAQNTFSQSIDLAGEWRFELDRKRVGTKKEWFNGKLDDEIQLPGCLTAQGYGDKVSMDTKWTGDIREIWTDDPYYKQFQKKRNFKMPFWLQPDRHYVGAAWYQREIEIPEDWKDKRITLFLERPHWKTTVWLNDNKIGTQNSLGTPHEYQLGYKLNPGKHLLTICVDNEMVLSEKTLHVGPNAHSISDHTQGNWNGIVGKIELRATGPVWMDDVQIYPNAADKTARVKIQIKNISEEDGKGIIKVSGIKGRIAGLKNMDVPVSWNKQGREAEFKLELGEDTKIWNEFNPNLYKLTLQLTTNSQQLDTHSVSFGLRDVGVEKTRITLNGTPIFIRGTLDCCIFPLTSHPPTDIDSWKRIINICKAHGLNHIRFHSWCPPEAAFIAADELGFYYQVECSAWPNQGVRLGTGMPIDNWLYEEANAMLKAYGNHPSFMLMAHGNEPGGKKAAGKFLGKFIDHYRARDKRRLYTSGSGWPLIPESDFHVTPRPRVQQWGAGLKSRVNSLPPETITDYTAFISKYPKQPVISHEIGQWCVYPNFEEQKKYTGLLKARNFEIFEDELENNGMLHQAKDFLMASGKLQALLYKEDIESALRTPGFGGFQLLDLHDFPGQGTALVGVLDPFWDSKGYITPAEYKRFSGEVVPLARLPKRIFEDGENISAIIELAQFGPEGMNVQPEWSLNNQAGQTIAKGELHKQIIKAGTLTKLGEISVPLKKIKKGTKLNLEVKLAGTSYANDWDLWVFPREAAAKPAKEIMVVNEMNDKATDHLENGGTVLWLPAPERIKNDEKHPVVMGFSSIFWNTVWTGWSPPHTLGILCDPKHPALENFPTDYHSNWQWWELMHARAPFILTEHKKLQPIVQVVDDWVTARKLALVFEVRVGKGKLLACSVDIENDLEKRPVAREFRKSLLNYMASNDFNPQTKLDTEDILDLVK